jgi:hypothetical protein
VVFHPPFVYPVVSQLARCPRSLLTAKSAAPVAKLVEWGLKQGLLVRTPALNAVLAGRSSGSAAAASGLAAASFVGGGAAVAVTGASGGELSDGLPDAAAAAAAAAATAAVGGSSAGSSCDDGSGVDDGASRLVAGHRAVVAALAHWPELERTHALALFVAHGGTKVKEHLRLRSQFSFYLFFMRPRKAKQLFFSARSAALGLPFVLF